MRLDPAVGAEIKKTRPSVIVSNDNSNHALDTLTVVPVTDQGQRVYPVEAAVPAGTGGLMKDSKVKCHQIRTVDKKRLVGYLGSLPDHIMDDIERAVSLHLGIGEGKIHNI